MAKLKKFDMDALAKKDEPRYLKNKLEAVEIGPKYELTDVFRWSSGEKVFQVRALRNFDEVVAGQLGGYVAGEHNLSHEGNCWIAQMAIARGSSRIEGDAWAMDNTVMQDCAKLRERACIFDSVILRGNCRVRDDMQLYGNIRVGGNTILEGNLRFDNSDELSAYLKLKFEERRAA